MVGGEKKAVLLSYDVRSDRFETRSERNTFFRGLFGYKRTVRRNDTVYHYDTDGLLDEIPHIKVEDSVFIIRRRDMQPFKEYFREWTEKVDVQMFKIKLEDTRITDDENR
jgi:hypothetical protein